MIDAIHDMCVTYGIKVRRVYLGGYFNREGGFHFDGAATRSVMHKIEKEREGAADVQSRQHFKEVLDGDALIIRRASIGMAEHRRYLLDLHYVVPKVFVPTKCKIACMEELFPERISNRQAYYDEIDAMHEWLSGRVGVSTFHDDQFAATA